MWLLFSLFFIIKLTEKAEQLGGFDLYESKFEADQVEPSKELGLSLLVIKTRMTTFLSSEA